MLSFEIIKQIDAKVDDDDFLTLARQAAQVAQSAHSLRDTQMRNLQNIVNSTTRFSEIRNFVMTQTARHKKEWGELGPVIMDTLQILDRYATEIAGSEPDNKGAVRLQLCRHWVKMVVAEYLYRDVVRRSSNDSH